MVEAIRRRLLFALMMVFLLGLVIIALDSVVARWNWAARRAARPAAIPGAVRSVVDYYMVHDAADDVTLIQNMISRLEAGDNINRIDPLTMASD